MTELNLSEKILDKIKKDHIEPKPKWQFVLKNFAIWTIGAFAMIFGGLATSVVIYMLVNNDWDVYEHISGSLPEFIFITMPYYWVVFVLIFILVAHYYLKKTKKGYRFRLRTIALGIFLTSTILGILFYNIGMGKAIEQVFANRMPFYGEMMNHRQGLWHMADEGRIAGKIVSVANENEFRIREINSKEWKVLMKTAIIPATPIIKEGNVVKIIGVKINEDEFEAFIIRPAGIPFGGMMEHRRDIRRELMNHPDIMKRMKDLHFRPGLNGGMIYPALPRPPFERNADEVRNTMIEDIQSR